MDAFLTILVKVLVSLASVAAVFLIGKAFAYFKSKNPKSFSELLVVANSVVKIVSGYLSANPDVAKEAQVVYDLFVKSLISLVPNLTAAEINSLFDAVVAELAKKIGVDITIFASTKVTKITKVTKYA